MQEKHPEPGAEYKRHSEHPQKTEDRNHVYSQRFQRSVRFHGSENNEFQALTYTGAKFLNKVRTTPNSDIENDLDSSILKPAKNQTSQSKSILDRIKEKLIPKT